MSDNAKNEQTAVQLVLAKISPTWMDRIYDELAQMDVELDDEPLKFGPRRLAQKLAESRKFLSRSETLFQDISRCHRILVREKNSAQTQYKLLESNLLANDPEVRAGRNIRDRDALVSVKLSAHVEYIHRIDQAIQDLECMDKVVKSRRVDLKDVQGRIRDQIKLCQEEVGLGSRWGSALPPGTSVHLSPRPASSSSLELAELDNLLKQETDLPAGDWEEEEDAEEEGRPASKATQTVDRTPQVQFSPVVVDPVQPPVGVELSSVPPPPEEPVAPVFTGDVDLDAVLGGLLVEAGVSVPVSTPEPVVVTPEPVPVSQPAVEVHEALLGLDGPSSVSEIQKKLVATADQLDVESFLGSAEPVEQVLKTPEVDLDDLLNEI